MINEKEKIEALATEIQRMMAETNVGGQFVLIGPNTAASFICLPIWTNLKFEQIPPSSENLVIEDIQHKDKDEQSMLLVNTLYFFSVTKEFLNQLTVSLINTIPSYCKKYNKEIDALSAKKNHVPTLH